jgi:mRNA-degrading endonuclease toxin of MazEF toxin-antitoxin module
VQGIAGVAATDQIRTVDKRRLVKCIGALDAGTAEVLLQALVELFAP